MDTEKEIKKIIFKYVSPGEYRVFLFGSRADGTAKKWSDWDVGVWGNKPLPPATLAAIGEDLDNSDIPYVVEVVDFSDVGPKFRKIAAKRTVVWKY